ncbi:F-box/LRR-repeat protein-like protein [Salvia divinorum]|uniref:F-box/LRR-repeat protein-like protein n=1 Tax=Salvia divinorum TaxID=28513 RepID=A0ABD1FKP8_SALDI
MARVQRRRLEDDYTGDRISMLPDEILVSILSRLLIRLQVAKPPTNLVEFRLSFNVSSTFASWIDDWLSYAVSRRVERLDLIFVTYLEEIYSFPYKEGNFPDNLKLLKKLRLHNVDVSGEAVAFMLGNCRLLEKLSLHLAGRLSFLEAVGTSPAFKCLEISDCMSLESVVVRGSELVCIKYKGVANTINQNCRFVLVDVPLLTQLSIQSEPCLLDFMLDMFDSVLPQLGTLKIYSTSIASHGLNFVMKMIPNLKQFVVVLLGSVYCDKCSLMPWFNVVSSPCLQRFVVEASRPEMIKTCCYCSTCHSFLTSDGDIDAFWPWVSDSIRDSYSRNKKVEFVGYRGVLNQFQMINQFVNYGTGLDKIIVDPRSFEHSRHMPWDRIYRNHMDMEDEVLARNRVRDQFKDSKINVTVL